MEAEKIVWESLDWSACVVSNPGGCLGKSLEGRKCAHCMTVQMVASVIKKYSYSHNEIGTDWIFLTKFLDENVPGWPDTHGGLWTKMRDLIASHSAQAADRAARACVEALEMKCRYGCKNNTTGSECYGFFHPQKAGTCICQCHEYIDPVRSAAAPFLIAPVADEDK